MPRTQSYPALILRTRPSGESNRELWLLCAEEGIVRATVFGGPKSRLRSHAAPFHSGQVWVYHDPVHDSRKLSDFDVRSWRPGIRELYERTMTAGAIAETILLSHGGGGGGGGGGGWAKALTLAESALDALETAGEETCELLLIYFLWHWAGILGIQPELQRCASCGGTAAADRTLLYSPREAGMLCASCSGNEESGPASLPALYPAGPGCRRWLEAIQPLSPSLPSRCTMDSKSFREAKSLTQAILTEALGRRPASWNW